MSQNIINTISIIGSLASVIGIIITYRQVLDTRQATQATNKAVMDAMKDVQRTLTIVEVAHHLAIISQIQTAIIDNKFELALKIMRDLRTSIIEVKETPLLLDTDHYIQLNGHITTLINDINNVHETLQKPDKLNKTVVIKHFDELSAQLAEIQAKFKHNTI